MSKFKGHTPGPWYWQDFPDISTGEEGYALLGEGGYAIAWMDACNAPPSYHPSNTRLIAAAPDLLAERDRLRRALEEISTWNEVDDADLDVCRMQWRGCVAIARAALKEEGRA